jgi:hypothetical protein
MRRPRTSVLRVFRSTYLGSQAFLESHRNVSSGQQSEAFLERHRVATALMYLPLHCSTIMYKLMQV